MQSDSLIKRLPRYLKMSELRIFVAVLEHRSFHKAAEVVHLTQPAVTKAIAGLEEMLGVKLFDRHAQGVQPTVHGLSLAPRAVAVFEELRRAAQDLTLISSGQQGSLRVGIVPMPAIPFLPIAVRKLRDEHPGIFVSVVEDREAELLDRLRKRDIELAILRMALLDQDDEMRFDRFFDEKLCVLAARDHPLAAREQLDWPELLQADWVLPPADCIFYEHMRRTLLEVGLEMPRVVVEAYSVHHQYTMALHGGMLAFGMRSQFEFAPEKALLRRLAYEFPTPVRSVGAMSLRAHELSPLARQLIGHIRHLAPPPLELVAPAPQSAAARPARRRPGS